MIIEEINPTSISHSPGIIIR